jgi:hypothetical protein
MDELYEIFMSWQYTVVALSVFLIFAFFNGLGGWKGLGYYAWKIEKKWVRKTLTVLEAVKTLFLPLWGFALGWIPSIPRPAQLAGEEVSQLSVALLYATAGLVSMVVVQVAKRSLEARGVNIDLDMAPKEQRKKCHE